MTKIELLQEIGTLICENCGEGHGSDCGIDPEDCSRIEEAEDLLNQYIESNE